MKSRRGMMTICSSRIAGAWWSFFFWGFYVLVRGMTEAWGSSWLAKRVWSLNTTLARFEFYDFLAFWHPWPLLPSLFQTAATPAELISTIYTLHTSMGGTMAISIPKAQLVGHALQRGKGPIGLVHACFCSALLDRFLSCLGSRSHSLPMIVLSWIGCYLGSSPWWLWCIEERQRELILYVVKLHLISKIKERLTFPKTSSLPYKNTIYASRDRDDSTNNLFSLNCTIRAQNLSVILQGLTKNQTRIHL